MTTVLTYIIVLVVLASFFWSGYFFRIWQETRIRKKMWTHIIKKIHTVPPLNINSEKPELDRKKEDFDLVDELMYEHHKNWDEDSIENLKSQLEIALLKEDYEKAAKIRDFLNTLGL